MEVFLIPTNSPRYELYCEVGAGPAVGPGENVSRGWKRWLVNQFVVVVGSVEAAKHGAVRRRAAREQRTIARRVHDRVICWLAERIAAQRLLWHLRGQTHVTAWFPDDMPRDGASDTIRTILRADADRHLRWLLVDGVGLVLSLLLIPLPGPNLILYYFTLRVGGHYLSRRGARHGLDDVEWRMQSSPDLSDLRRAFALDPPVRQRRMTEIAARLRLQHLAAFCERVAVAAP